METLIIVFLTFLVTSAVCGYFAYGVITDLREKLEIEQSLIAKLQTDLNHSWRETERLNQANNLLVQQNDHFSSLINLWKGEISKIKNVEANFCNIYGNKTFTETPEKRYLSQYKRLLTEAYNLCDKGVLTKEHSQHLFKFSRTTI